MTPGRVARVALLSVALAGLAAPPAGAEDVSRSEFSELSGAAAAGDPGALAALEDVTSVEGEPFDFTAVSAGADSTELEARLAELGSGDPGEQPPEAPPAGAQAPPNTGGSAGDDADGGFGLPLPPGIQIAGLALIAVLAALSARMVARHRLEEAAAPHTGAFDAEPPTDQGSLEREAERAERAGDFAGALRLRFRAGLLRLDAEGVVALRPSLTPSGAARATRSSALADLASTYERVFYAGRPASEEDVASARALWPRALKEAVAR